MPDGSAHLEGVRAFDLRCEDNPVALPTAQQRRHSGGSRKVLQVRVREFREVDVVSPVGCHVRESRSEPVTSSLLVLFKKAVVAKCCRDLVGT